MKQFSTWTLILTLVFTGCTQSVQQQDETQIAEVNNEDVLRLIKRTLIWADSENSITLIPVVAEDSFYTKFDFEEHEKNLEILKATNLFSHEFIENYNNIILDLDKKLRNNEFEYGPWYVGDLPPFNFASNYSPWCECQDHLDWNSIRIKQLDPNTFSWSWQENSDFGYKFRVSNEDDKLKISYMIGFEYE